MCISRWVLLGRRFGKREAKDEPLKEAGLGCKRNDRCLTCVLLSLALF